MALAIDALRQRFKAWRDPPLSASNAHVHRVGIDLTLRVQVLELIKMQSAPLLPCCAQDHPGGVSECLCNVLLKSSAKE